LLRRRRAVAVGQAGDTGFLGAGVGFEGAQLGFELGDEVLAGADGGERSFVLLGDYTATLTRHQACAAREWVEEGPLPLERAQARKTVWRRATGAVC